MSDTLSEALLISIQKGNVDECRKLLMQGAQLSYADAEGNSPASVAVTSGQLECLRFLISEGAPLDIEDMNGNTPLHHACEKDNREMILALLLGGADAAKKNKNDAKPGDKSPNIGLFIKQITAENKAFGALSDEQKRSLKSIFDLVAKDDKKISLEYSKEFNKYMNDVDDDEAEKDAKDFISSCALCNKEKVNLDEWYFAFAKLWVCDPTAFQKFLEEYDNTLGSKGPFGI